MKVWVELLKENGDVTDKYLQSIADVFLGLDCEIEYVYSCSFVGNPANDIYVVAIAPSVCKLHVRNTKRIVFWSQGVFPEESLMRNGSKLRYWCCSKIEKKALMVANKVFLVSEAQKRHYENKYRISLDGVSYIMPCSNEEIHKESFFYKQKYEHPTFLYAGSLARYQCIDKILDAFVEVQKAIPESKLFFYTKEINSAKSLIHSRGLNNAFVNYAPQAELEKELRGIKYGFVIRDDSVVNSVATPTKLSTYIANGIIPIYSESLQAFSETAGSIPRIAYTPDSFIEDLLSMEQQRLCPNEIYDAYSSYFSRNFDYKKRSQELKSFLKNF